MAKTKLKFEPGVLPRSITEITREYIQGYVAHGVKGDTITPETFDNFTNEITNIEENTSKSEMEKYAAIRTLFVNTFIPSLKAKTAKKMSDYFKALKEEKQNNQK